MVDFFIKLGVKFFQIFFLEKKGEMFSVSLFSRNESEIEMTENRDREVKFQKNSRESRLLQVTAVLAL